MFKQYELPYASNALEPFIDATTVETHHGKHHATYTKNFNDAVEKAGLAGKSAEEILASLDSVDPSLRGALKNNGGGYYNHNLYFMTLSPNPKKAPEGALKAAIDEAFGGVDKLVELLSSKAAGQFGSGWAFLSVTPDKKLVVTASPNQDNPISEGTGNIPILALDVWEHAYYLKYKNLRADYIKAFFEVLDWGKVEELFDENTK